MGMNASLLRRGLVIALAAIMVVPATTFAAVTTDQEDYSPGSVVTISGNNDGVNEGEGFLEGESIIVDVYGPNGYVAQCSDTFEDGAFECQVTLWDSLLAVGDYAYTATGQTSGTSQSGAFTDAASVDIDAKNPTAGARPWYRTDGGVVTLTVSGDYICTTGGSGNAKCSSPTGVTVEILRDSDNVPVASKAATLNAGDWSASFTFPDDASIPADGQFDARATYTWNVCAGSPTCTPTGSTGSAALTSDKHFAVDNTKPALTIGTVSQTPAATGNQTALQIDGTALDTLSGLPSGGGAQKVKVELRADAPGGTLGTDKLSNGTVSGTVSNDWTVEFTRNELDELEPGVYCLVATGINDVAGNAADAVDGDCVTVEVADTTAPVITVTELEGTTVWTGSWKSTDNGTPPLVYSNTDVTFTWSADEDGSYRVLLNQCNSINPVIAVGVNTSDNYDTVRSGTDGVVMSTVVASNFTSDGTQNLRVCMTDAAGNKSEAQFKVVWDVTDPDVAITEPDDDASLLPSEYLALCTAATAEVCGTASDAIAGLKAANGVEALIRWNDGTEDLWFDGTDFAGNDAEIWRDVTASLSAGAWSLGFDPHAALGFGGDRAIWEGFESETFVATARALDKAGNDRETAEVSFTVVKSAVGVVYLGDNIHTYDPLNPQPLTMHATVSSLNPACVVGAEVDFYIDRDFDGEFEGDERVAAGPFEVDAYGAVSASEMVTDSGVYEVRVEVLESLDCLPASSDNIASVVTAGDAANGGGWYRYDANGGGSPRVNFGFTVRKDCGGQGQVVCPDAAADIPYRGQFVALNNGKWRLKGTLDKYGTTTENCASSGWSGVCGTASGIGDLFAWEDIGGGVYDWVMVADDVAFTVGLRDGGSARKGSFHPDHAGMLTISYFDGLTFTSAPMELKGGGLTLSGVDSGTSTSTSTGGGSKGGGLKKR